MRISLPYIFSVAFLFLFLTVGVYGQSNLAIGSWKAHLPYSAGIDVTISERDIIYASREGLVFLDRSDLAPRFFSKVDGLSQANILRIKNHDHSGTLVVAYENGVIDLLRSGRVIVLRDIADFRNFPIGKKINQIYDYPDNDFVLLAGEYGLSRLDVVRGLFDFTVFTGFIDANVYGVTVWRGRIYMATSRGLYVADDIRQSNLADLSFWTRLGPESELPQEYECFAVTTFSDELFASIDGDLFRWEEDGFVPFYIENGYEARVLSAEGPHLLAGFRCVQDCTSRLVGFDTDLVPFAGGTFCTDRILNVVEDGGGRLWYADEFRGIRYAESPGASCGRIVFNTPYTKDVTGIAIDQNRVYVASGGVTDNYGYLFRSRGFYSLIEGEWDYYNPENVELFRQKDLKDFFRIAVQPDDGTVWVGTFWGGVIQYGEDTIAVYDKDNSSLQGIVGDEQRTRIAGLAFDEDNNLWVSNYGAPRPISVRTGDGQWTSFAVPGVSTFLSEAIVDRNGYKWFILVDRTQGVLVFDEGDLNIAGDERYWVFTESNSALPTNQTNSIAVDLDGNVWVGTTLGPVVFENCGDGIFSGECFGNQRLVDQDGDLDLLLGTEDILCIAVDGGNRKWFGTRNGVFVQSPSGQQEIYRFSTTNSPLLDNTILDIEINPIDGEAFIGTAQGLMSYRGEATEGGNSFSTDVKAFPNPVRPEYDGPIAIKGLAAESVVKITDIRGRLIYETQSIGGQAIWDGRDYNGRKASPGVYLVFANNDVDFGKPARAATKIVIVR